MFEAMLPGLLVALRWDMLLATLVGTLAGMVVGLLPGLTSTMGVALLIPLTFDMRPEVGLAMLGGMYCASTYAGSITAILFNIPGTPHAAATTLDGHPMALKGEATRAISLVTLVSSIGGLLGVLVLLFLAPPLALLSLRFGSPEYFLLAVLGISTIASLSAGSWEKGLLSGVLGLLLSTVGMHPVTGFSRFTFHQPFLYDGIPLVVALIGLFSIPEIIDLAGMTGLQPMQHIGKYGGHPFRYVKDIICHRWVVVRSSIIGIIIGIIPGTGTDVAIFLAYGDAKRASRNPAEFGHGAIAGVIAPETANNALVGGSLVPTLTLGIPGNAVTAVFLGGLIIHGLRPGVSMFTENALITYGFIFSLVVANIIFVPIGFLCARYAMRLLSTPPSVLAPLILMLSVIGSLAIRGLPQDIVIMLIMGVIGYVFRHNGVSVVPLVLGLILGGMAEGELTRSLAIVRNDVLALGLQFVTRPISCVLLLLIMLTLYQGLRKEFRPET